MSILFYNEGTLCKNILLGMQFMGEMMREKRSFCTDKIKISDDAMFSILSKTITWEDEPVKI